MSALTLHTIDADISSVAIKDGANQLAIDGSGNISAVVSATDLDVRDLAFATDSVDVSGSEVSLDAATLAALENITVSATDLDIRDLAFATDKVDVSNSVVALDAGTLAALENITVSATDLDVRDLVFATDKVDVSGSTVTIDAGSLAALESITVQNGAGASAVNIQDGGNSLTVDAVDLDIRDLVFATDKVDVSGSVITTTQGAYTSWKNTQETVGLTAVQLVATPLASRDEIVIQNTTGKDFWVGPTSAVTISGATVGRKIPKGTELVISLDASANIWAISDAAGQLATVTEFAY
jgi:hypothetical protein